MAKEIGWQSGLSLEDERGIIAVPVVPQPVAVQVPIGSIHLHGGEVRDAVGIPSSHNPTVMRPEGIFGIRETYVEITGVVSFVLDMPLTLMLKLVVQT